MKCFVFALMLSGCCVSCEDGDVHSSRTQTRDGGSELIAGPFDWKCAAKIDGVPVKQGVAMSVKPGVHRVACDDEQIDVDVPAGESVTVDYFGP